MSQTDSPSWDDLDSVETEDSGNGEWINLEPGQEVGGTITDYNPDGDDHGVIEIDGRPFSLNWTLKQKLLKSLVEGAQVVVRKSEDEESFTDDDGEEVTYNPKDARFGPPGGDE